ncbi:unnamed protein product [Arabis nemorensis]|uniref:Uncharacterized protein n=1 Tax=Arabis nemorensis TaxID=586526 RepID=A0A565C494_9BRAS|nr:unnamed protein product [Arabis nemorensis]
MDTQNNQTETNQTENVPTPAPVSCRKHVKDENATFFANLKGHIDEFVHASMDEHKACFQNTMNKILERAKAIGEKKVEVKEV